MFLLFNLNEGGKLDKTFRYCDGCEFTSCQYYEPTPGVKCSVPNARILQDFIDPDNEDTSYDFMKKSRLALLKLELVQTIKSSDFNQAMRSISGITRGLRERPQDDLELSTDRDHIDRVIESSISQDQMDAYVEAKMDDPSLTFDVFQLRYLESIKLSLEDEIDDDR